MYKLNDIHNSDVGNKGNFEKMVDVYKRQNEYSIIKRKAVLL